MPAPIVLGILALCAGGTGAGAAVSGIKDYWQVFKEKKETNKRCRELMKLYEAECENTQSKLDELGKLELTVLDCFEEYSTLIEKIQHRPEFDPPRAKDVRLAAPNLKDLTSVALVAHTLLGNMGGAALGTLSAFATAGAVPSIVAAVGTAGTGTAISTLSGAAAWNAILAAMGGGTLAAGGGGIMLGATILSSLTCGIGILVGGVVIKLTGQHARKKQKEHEEDQVALTEEKVDKLCEHLKEIAKLSEQLSSSLNKAKGLYDKHILILSDLVETQRKTDWKDFSRSERLNVENATRLVTLLYNMCQLQLIRQTEDKDGMLISEANNEEVGAMISCAEAAMDKLTAKPSIFQRLFQRK